MWKIYKHTSPSGKCYIGQTIQTNPNIRWQNGKGYKSHNPIFFLAIQKYGWENFKHEIIEDNIKTKQTANEREIFWISFYDSFRNGYNSTPGGDLSTDETVSAKPVCKISIETGKLICKYKSESDAERKTGIKGRNIAAVCLKQGQNTAGGFYWCFEDELDNFIEPKDKRKLSTKIVYCLELNKTFNSSQEAAKFAGIHVSGINAVCDRRNQITAGGLHWCYLTDKDSLLEYIDSFKNKEKNIFRRMVIQIDKNTLKPLDIFNSLKEAETKTGISSQQIGKCASGTYITAGGYFWCFKEEWDENWKPLLRYKTNAKKVVCIETGEIYDNLNKASLATGAHNTSISQVCNQKLLKAGGYHWCWLKTFLDNEYVLPEPKSKRKIICIETLEKFASISDAAQKYKLKIPNIIECCKKKQRTSGGYHWCYLDEFSDNYRLLQKRYTSFKKVVCVETGKIYESINKSNVFNWIYL